MKRRGKGRGEEIPYCPQREHSEHPERRSGHNPLCKPSYQKHHTCQTPHHSEKHNIKWDLKRHETDILHQSFRGPMMGGKNERNEYGVCWVLAKVIMFLPKHAFCTKVINGSVTPARNVFASNSCQWKSGRTKFASGCKCIWLCSQGQSSNLLKFDLPKHTIIWWSTNVRAAKMISALEQCMWLI